MDTKGRLAVAVSVAVVALCGCSGSGSARHGDVSAARDGRSASSASSGAASSSSVAAQLPDRPVGALGDALRSVADQPAARRTLQFSRPAAAADATADAADRTHYLLAREWAATELMTSPTGTRRALGIDPLSAAYQVSAGTPDAAAGILGGLDLHALGPHLVADGASTSTSGTSTTYRLPVSGLGQNAALTAALGAAFDLTFIRTRGTVLRFAGTSQLLATVDPGATSLADDSDFAAAAACLGDPLAADFSDDLRALSAQRGPADGPAPSAPGVRVVAVGLLGAAGAAPTDELCVRTATPSQATRLAAGIRRALADGRSVRSAKYWRDLVLAPVVQVSGTTVRLSGHPPAGTAGGLLLTGLEAGADLPGLGGES